MSRTCLFLSRMSSNSWDMADIPGHGSWSVAQSRVWRACPPYKSHTKNAIVVIRYLGALTQLIPAAGIIKRARNTNNNNRPTNDINDHHTSTSTSNTATDHENSVALLGSLASPPFYYLQKCAPPYRLRKCGQSKPSTANLAPKHNNQQHCLCSSSRTNGGQSNLRRGAGIANFFIACLACYFVLCSTYN
jgi:hypothetical protein